MLRVIGLPPSTGVALDSTSTDIQSDTTSGTASAGSSSYASRADHQHALVSHDHSTVNKGGAIPESSVTNLTSDLSARLQTSNNLSELTSTASTARGNISAAKTGANSDITSLSGLTTPLTVGQGGTGDSTLTGLVVGNGTSAMSSVTAPNGAVVGTSDTQTLTNKRSVKRVAALTDAATVTPDSDDYDAGKLLTLSQTTTIANPTGTPTSFQQYILRIKSVTSQGLTFGAQYRGNTAVALPSVTTGSSKTDYLGFQWNSDDSKWDLIALSMGY
jgi:hypothetical protein